MSIRLHNLLTFAVLTTFLAAGAAAQDRTGENRAAEKRAAQGRDDSRPEQRRPRAAEASKASKELPAQHERAALGFAREHHPELHTLLMRLREGRPGQYLTAIRQLHQTRERLERFSERMPERYEASLAQWKIDSRLRLLVARMTMSDDPALDEQLQELLAERTRLRLELLKLDRERLRSRLERVEGQIETLEADPAAVAEKDLAAIRRSLGIPTSTKTPAPPKTPKKPRNKKPATTGP